MIGAIAAALCVSAVWMIPFLILQFRAAARLEDQESRHTHERELWRSERQILQARSLKPAPSSRRPGAPELVGRLDDVINSAKLNELKRIAGGDVPAWIIPTDL